MATQTRPPNGNNGTNQWTASAGNQYECVDEGVAAHNSDTDYEYVTLQATARQARHTFAAFDITSTSVTKVTAAHVWRLETVSSGGFTTVNRLIIGGSAYDSAADTTKSTSYTTYTTDWLTNPRTSAAWLESDVEGTGANPLSGITIMQTHATTTPVSRITAIDLTVTYETEASPGGAVVFNPYDEVII